VSTNSISPFAIVRTGAYVDYGFGGFIYTRTGGVSLPTSAKRAIAARSQAFAISKARAGLQYSRENIDITIDFDEFNDTTGTEMTADAIAAINDDADANLTAIPTATFTVGPGVLDDNGEVTSEVTSFFGDNEGTAVALETGNYYAVMSDDRTDANVTDDQIVGVVVTTSTVGQPDGVTVRDTGGFIVARPHTLRPPTWSGAALPRS